MFELVTSSDRNAPRIPKRNWLSRVRNRRQIFGISVVIAVLCTCLTTLANTLVLPQATLWPAIKVGAAMSVALGMSISWFIGMTILHANKLTDLLEEAAFYDSLTGALTRRRFFELANAGDLPAGVVLIADMDALKQINDTFGHAMGDTAIVAMYTALRHGAAPEALICRLGGDEFVVYLPDSNLATARATARRMRHHLRDAAEPDHPPLSISIGLAERAARTSIESAIAQADKALYLAKRSRIDPAAKIANAPLLSGNTTPDPAQKPDGIPTKVR